VQTADAYFAGKPEAETLAELQDIHNRAAEKVRQSEEAARQKAQHEAEAVTEW
jgi:hypothetical protein